MTTPLSPGVIYVTEHVNDSRRETTVPTAVKGDKGDPGAVPSVYPQPGVKVASVQDGPAYPQYLGLRGVGYPEDQNYNFDMAAGTHYWDEDQTNGAREWVFDGISWFVVDGHIHDHHIIGSGSTAGSNVGTVSRDNNVVTLIVEGGVPFAEVNVPYGYRPRSRVQAPIYDSDTDTPGLLTISDDGSMSANFGSTYNGCSVVYVTEEPWPS